MLSKIKAGLDSKVSSAFPVPFPFTFSDDCTTFVSMGDLSMNSGSVTAWAIYGAYQTLLTRDPIVATAILEKGSQPKALSESWDQSWPQKEISRSEFELARALSEDNFAKSFQYFLELTGAQQSGNLNERNLMSYFLSKGTEINLTGIMKLLPALAAATLKLDDVPEFQKRALDNDWLRYHTTVSSGSGLVLMMLDATGTTNTNAGPFKVPSHVVDAVVKSTKETWNKGASDAIPISLKGVAHVYLEALGMLPSSIWYQGIKGRSSMSPATVSAIKSYAIRTTFLKADTKGIESAVDIDSATQALDKAGIIPSFN